MSELRIRSIPWIHSRRLPAPAVVPVAPRVGLLLVGCVLGVVGSLVRPDGGTRRGVLRCHLGDRTPEAADADARIAF